MNIVFSIAKRHAVKAGTGTGVFCNLNFESLCLYTLDVSSSMSGWSY